MKRFKLREQLIIKFLATDFILLSAIGLVLFLVMNNYSAIYAILWILLLSSPVIFFFSWLISTRIDRKLTILNDSISKMAEGNYDLEKNKASDEIGQIQENLAYTAGKIARKEKKSKTLLNEYNQILNHLTSGLLITDSSGEVVFVNDVLKEIFSVDDIEGKTVIEAFQNHDLAQATDKAMLGKILDTKIDIAYPKARSLSIKAFPLEQKDQTVKSCAVLIDDSTSIDGLATLKRDFIVNVSHELRTPIASIKSLTEALQASRLENKDISKKFVNDIKNETDRLSLLVQDILDLSKIEREVKLKTSRISISKLLKEITDKYSEPCKEKDVSLNLDVEKELPLIAADKDQLYKAFSNLVDNAVKFTSSKGKVKVKASQKNGYLRVSVSDTGPGIKQKDIDRIFERFYTGSNDRSIAAGTGLGLSIVKHAIDKHKGSVKVKSSWGKGSTFEVKLPS